MSKQHARLNQRRWAAFRKSIFSRDGYRCTKCLGAGRLECHHLIPLEKGGAAFDPENCEAVCRDCHIAHHRPDPRPGAAAWRALLDEIIRGD